MKNEKYDPDTIRRGGFPRGHFYRKPTWSKDTTKDYFSSFDTLIAWPLLKLAILIYIGYFLSFQLKLSNLQTSFILLVIVATY